MAPAPHSHDEYSAKLNINIFKKVNLLHYSNITFWHLPFFAKNNLITFIHYLIFTVFYLILIGIFGIVLKK